ncbi:MAG: leucyl/phenylalanyl-tRNA--protein transferase, partial [Methylococcales bacterium]|nr:leucyl/phenylalanyl-tRNA--protein transferase [Methylococcales bacterium]
LNPYDPSEDFPSFENALKTPDGLLAVGGCLSVERLINAYQKGIFPWYNPDEPILWWSPNPRLIITPDRLKISRSLAKVIRQQRFELSVDRAFSEVIKACSATREEAEGTWISEEMIIAYQQLHQQGFAHSVEAWSQDQLVGGLYGVAIGHVFFGESMFHTQTNASKVVFVHLIQQLQQWGYQLIDCQVHSDHLVSLGAYEIDRNDFIAQLNRYCPQAPKPSAWNTP